MADLNTIKVLWDALRSYSWLVLQYLHYCVFITCEAFVARKLYKFYIYITKATWCKVAIYLLWSYTTEAHVMNYEGEWLPPASLWGLHLRLGMGHSGHEGQSYYDYPAGSGSSSQPIDPHPAEQTADLDVTLSHHPGLLALSRTLTDSLMGHQTKLPLWLASVMNDKYHSPSAVLSLQPQDAQCVWEDGVMLCGVLSRFECRVSLGV